MSYARNHRRKDIKQFKENPNMTINQYELVNHVWKLIIPLSVSNIILTNQKTGENIYLGNGRITNFK